MFKALLQTTAIVGVGIYIGTATASALAAGTVAKVAVGFIVGSTAASMTSNLILSDKDRIKNIY